MIDGKIIDKLDSIFSHVFSNNMEFMYAYKKIK